MYAGNAVLSFVFPVTETLRGSAVRIRVSFIFIERVLRYLISLFSIPLRELRFFSFRVALFFGVRLQLLFHFYTL